MTITQVEKQDAKSTAYEILNELYQSIDDTFIGYFISLTATRVWRPHLEKYETDYRNLLQEERVPASEIETRIAAQSHFFSDGEFGVQTTTKNLRAILTPGNLENAQAKNAIKIIYDGWESIYRPKLQELLSDKIQSDIWGDLSYIRHSIAHRNSKGIEKLKNAKIIKDFSPNHEVILTPIIMEQIREELENWYTEFLMIMTEMKNRWA